MARAQQPQSPQESALGPLWIVVGVFALGLVIWFAAHPYIVAFVFKLRLYEINALSLFTSQLNHIAEQIRQIPPSYYGSVTFNDLDTLSTRVGDYVRYPVVAILIVLGLVMYISDPVTRYKRTYTMQRLVNEEVGDWPQIAPVVKLDLVNQPIEEGPWAMAMTPLQFARKHNLLCEERVVPNSSSGSETQARMTASILRGEAYRVFTLQLGPYWEGPLALPMHRQALFAIFAARVAGDRDTAFALTDQINASTAHGKLDFSGVQALLMKHKDQKQVLRATQRHAFVYTAMASLLLLARGDGVLPSADFLWLKPIDRLFWFMLNTVGRQTSVCEVAGCYAHWLTEVRFGRPIRVPVVEQAVNALEIAIREIIYKPESDEE